METSRSSALRVAEERARFFYYLPAADPLSLSSILLSSIRPRPTSRLIVAIMKCCNDARRRHRKCMATLKDRKLLLPFLRIRSSPEFHFNKTVSFSL